MVFHVLRLRGDRRRVNRRGKDFLWEKISHLDSIHVDFPQTASHLCPLRREVGWIPPNQSGTWHSFRYYSGKNEVEEAQVKQSVTGLAYEDPYIVGYLYD